MVAKQMPVLKVGYDAQAFLSPNGGLGKGLQLRNLLGQRIERFTGFASTFPNSSGMKLVQEGAFRHGVWQQVSLPGSLKRHKIDLFLAPQNTAPFFLPSSVRLILVLHDTILLHHFQRHKLSLRDVFRRQQIRSSVARAEVVLTVSEYSRSEILRVFPDANVRVIPCTIPETWFAPALREVRDGYLLMVTSPAPHKNAAGGVAGYASYARAAGRSALPLKIVGLARERESYAPLLRELGVDQLVSFTPFLAEEDLRDLYRKAEALILPSFVEGFGIPLLEAMATGTPALTSDRTSLPEVGGTAPFYFNPHNPADIGSAITSVITDSTLRARMVQLGRERAQCFHPSVISRMVDEFWRNLTGS